ncbi:MAG: phospho-N-acetylmuramoyl-pentapeptide-transferase [bacterium]|nr:phospho-N-acetylmuramoyl-pentapeptide-transferase [bacterium]
MTETLRLLIISTAAFAIAIILAPFWSRLLTAYRLGKQIRTENVPVFASLHKKKEGTPTMGGLIIWLTVGLLVFICWLAGDPLNFLSRGQTFLPLGAMAVAALVGLGDDLLGIFHIGPNGGGLKMRHRLALYTLIALGGAWWFQTKLEWDLLHIPFVGDFNIGFWYIPIFLFIIVATAFSVNETDGLDGLAGGVLLIAFAAYTVMAFVSGRYDLAALTVAIIGALMAFLWFNVFPARFFMGDTGSMSLGVTLGVIAMLTNSALLLPFIAFVPMLESFSVIAQVISKKLRGGKKIFLSSPLHHHFEGCGWPETNVTMRFWIIAAVMAGIGLILWLIDRGL